MLTIGLWSEAWIETFRKAMSLSESLQDQETPDLRKAMLKTRQEWLENLAAGELASQCGEEYKDAVLACFRGESDYAQSRFHSRHSLKRCQVAA